MKSAIIGLIAAWSAVALAGPSDRRAPRAISPAEAEFLRGLHINETRPRLRDHPARYQNISDDEVREVQSAAFEVLPHAFVSIGTVVTGCPCEDGAMCTDQVWVMAADKKRAVGLLLSRIDGRWEIGPVQRWWLRREALDARFTGDYSYGEYKQAEHELTLEFPACEALPKALNRFVSPAAGAAAKE